MSSEKEVIGTDKDGSPFSTLSPVTPTVVAQSFGEGSSLQITNHKLNGKNFLQWSHETTGVSLNKDQIEQLLALLKQQTVPNPVTATSRFAHQGTALHVENQIPWILDSGASDHMTGNSFLFYSYTPCHGSSRVKIADGTFSCVAGKGSIRLSDQLVLHSVLHVPKLACNLVSISKLTQDLNCTVTFSVTSCHIQEQGSERTIGIAKEDGGLYYFKKDECMDKQITIAKCVSSISNKDIMMWHHRLGHPNFHYLKRLFPEFFINKNPSSFRCDICQLAKHTRTSYPAKPYLESSPFTLIHSDIWGPSRVKNVTGIRWFITFIDDHTRVCWVYLFKEKSEVSKIFQTFHSMIKTQFQTSVKVLRTDNGTEYFKSILGEYLAINGIIHQSSCTDTPQQNGVAERKNRHLLEVARALMFTMHVPKYLWGEAILTASHLINRMPSKILQFQTPLSVLLQTYPMFRSFSSIPLKIFGCTAFVHVHSQNRSKLDPKAIKCVFIGYSSTQRGYKCYSPSLRRMFVSMDVTFHETQPYFPTSHLQGENLDEDGSWDFTIEQTSISQPVPLPLPIQIEPPESSPQPLPDSSEPIMPHYDQLEIGETNLVPQLLVYSRRNHSRNSSKPDAQQGQASEPVPLPGPETTSRSVDFSDSSDLDLPIALRKGTRSCTQHPISKYVSYENLSPSFSAFTTTLTNIKIPKDIKEALADPKWRFAVQEEMGALEKNGTWEFVKLPSGKKTVGCKWVFTVKFNADGSVNRYKARLVAKGFTQAYGIDYKETFAPVAKLNSVRVLLSLAANLDWPLQQLDVKNAFLNGDLHEEVYMDSPPGFEKKELVCKLRKSLYGLKQSPREWFEKFTQAVKERGFVQAQSDHTIFYKHSKEGKKAILIVYVDDIIVTGDDQSELESLKGYLASKFELKDLGALKYFLGMEVARSSSGIFVSQRKYVLDLLQETGMLGCKPAETPMESNVKLGMDGGKDIDQESYQRLVGKLIYLSHTRPDIAFAVSVVSQFMHSPKERHLEAVLRLLRYLKRTPGRGLLFKKGDYKAVEIYTDADWAGSSVDRRSTSGYCTYVWGNLVTWRSKKQPVVARSSAEAEFRALAHGMCEGIWLGRLLEELKISSHSPMRIYCDNKAAVSIAHNPVHHDRTKHVEVDRHFIREKIDNGSFCMTYIPTKEQTADILTKGLHKPHFEDLVNKLGMTNIYIPA